MINTNAICTSLQERQLIFNVLTFLALLFLSVFLFVCFSLGCLVRCFFSGPRERYSYLHHSPGQSLYIRRLAPLSVSLSDLHFPSLSRLSCRISLPSHKLCMTVKRHPSLLFASLHDLHDISDDVSSIF